MHRPVALAFDVGGTAVKAAVVDGGAVLHERTVPSRRGPAILDVVAETARELLAELDPDQQVQGVGVAMPGLVDAERGICVRSVNLGITDLDVAGDLGRRLGLPVRVGHDVTTAGSAVHRAAGVVDPVVVVLGTGIAAVAYVDGRPVPGVSGQAGELGHLVVRPGGPVCACGARGCLEAVAGAGAMTRRYAELTGRTVDGVAALVVRRETDAVAAAIWEEAVSALADALVSVCVLLAPGALVLAGGLSESGELLRAPLHRLMVERSRIATVPPVLVSELRSRAGLIGAAELALAAGEGLRA